MLVLAEHTDDRVRERWARVARLGLHPESDAYPVGTSDADLHERRDRLDDVLREERELLEPISAQLAGGPLVALVADRDGVILSAHADRHIVDPMARVRLVEGARWDEETRGTNAIGTALVEGRAVAVVGSAHFEVRNRGLFCYATPVHDAYGEVVAVLDVTGPMDRHDAGIGLAVQAAGVALERALRAIAYGDRRSGALAAIERLVHRSSGAAMLIEASGVARVINAPARSALRLTGDATVTCERLFGIPFDVLLSTSAGRGGMRFETRNGSWRITLDPIGGVGQRTLALLVHLEPERTAAPLSTRSLPVSSAPPAPEGFAGILGEDRGLVAAREVASRFARTSLPVLLLSETGTGKELFARAIHGASERRRGPFVAVNCGALSPDLIASEVFGHAPGAFTGASRAGTEGRLGAAHGGTLFLDEIAEMPQALQVALLRVLDSGIYQRVGEARERRADFRLICATCRDLPALVAEGHFRNDLFYRIQGACVAVPALRDRTDAVWLAERLLEELAPCAAPRLADDAARFVQEHDWPGNVRELKSAMAHALALAPGEAWVRREHLPSTIHPRASARRAGSVTRKRLVQEAIETTLGSCHGNVSEAARRLGVGRGTIYRAVKGSKAD